jgi:hypothetical protein
VPDDRTTYEPSHKSQVRLTYTRCQVHPDLLYVKPLGKEEEERRRGISRPVACGSRVLPRSWAGEL